MKTPCERLSQDLGSLFQCQPWDHGVRIRTPFLYPDGDYIDLFYRANGDGISMVTDLGETVRWLRTQTLTPRRTVKQEAMVQDTALNHGVEFFRGMLRARVRDEKDLAEVVTRVSQAALRVSDIWFTFRTRSVESVGDEVADVLTENKVQFERRPKLLGRSGRVWTPDFQTSMPARGSLMYVLSTGNRSAARSLTHTAHTAWHDLSHKRTGPEALRFVSLFDDTLDVWEEADMKLLGELSEVAYWSRPEELVGLLTAG